MSDASLPIILAIALRSPSYLVLKRILMFIADLMAESKSLIFCETKWPRNRKVADPNPARSTNLVWDRREYIQRPTAGVIASECGLSWSATRTITGVDADVSVIVDCKGYIPSTTSVP